jgi:hypothetical protein
MQMYWICFGNERFELIFFFFLHFLLSSHSRMVISVLGIVFSLIKFLLRLGRPLHGPIKTRYNKHFKLLSENAIKLITLKLLFSGSSRQLKHNATKGQKPVDFVEPSTGEGCQQSQTHVALTNDDMCGCVCVSSLAEKKLTKSKFYQPYNHHYPNKKRTNISRINPFTQHKLSVPLHSRCD